MDENQEQKLSRSLKSRHITMIAIGGAIGTGLFLGSGSAIRKAGPSIILSYLVVGIFCFFMMRALGELLMSDLSKHSFIDFVGEYLGDRMEFATGWIYWACWLTLAMADLTASGIYLRYWFPALPQWVGPLLIILILMLINTVNVGFFGELESAFSMIKVAAIVILIVIGFALAFLHAPVDGGQARFANLVNYGGFFPTGVRGFLMSFQMVVFAFVGIEMVGLTAGESKNPATDIPKAINTLPVRIGLFYIGSMIAIMAVYPWTRISTTSSPFVQVFKAVGIPAAAGIINFVVLTAALSATNSSIFSTSRSLYALAQGHNAPSTFGRLSPKAVPVRALNFSSAVLFVIVILNYIMPGDIFSLISTISTICFILVWLIILWCHLAYRRAQRDKKLTFKMPGFPLTDWLTIVFFLLALLMLYLDPQTRVALVTALLLLVVMIIGYRLVQKSRSKTN